jgi:hypothetical protein
VAVDRNAIPFAELLGAARVERDRDQDRLRFERVEALEQAVRVGGQQRVDQQRRLGLDGK